MQGEADRAQQAVREAREKAEANFRDALASEAGTLATNLADIIKQTFDAFKSRLKAELQVERGQENPALAGQQRE